jgi:type III secretion protein L
MRGPPPPSSQRPQKPIIERELVGAKAEAHRIVGDAEQRAQQIIEEAEAQAEQIKENAYNEGYQEGLGRYTEQTTKALLEVQRLKQELEPEFIGLVRTCVEKVLGQELRLNPDAVIGLVRNTLRDATQQREIIVRIHPDDAEHLRKNQRRLLDVLARASQIEVRDDQAVSRGGCIVLTELGTIDASLERQLAALESALQHELAAGPSDEDQGESEEEYEDEEA